MQPEPAPSGNVVVRRYVAVGDSTTEGVGDPLPSGELQGWADRFAATLARRHGRLAYANLAVRGRRTAQILAEQAEPALALEPDLITAVVGVNDLVASQFSAATFDAEVDELFATLRRDGAIVLSSTPPDRRVWGPDRLHPNPVGHALLAEAMSKLLDAAPVTVSAAGHDGYGVMPYARAGIVWSAAWAGHYLVPRTVRRLRGRSSGDGRTAKFATYVELVADGAS